MPSVNRRLLTYTISFGSLGIGLGGVAFASWVGRGWKPFSLMSSKQLKVMRWTLGGGSVLSALVGGVSLLGYQTVRRFQGIFGRDDLRALLEEGYDPNTRRKGGSPLVTEGIVRGDFGWAHLVLNYHADPNGRGLDRRTPLIELALARDHIEEGLRLARRLIDLGADLEAQDDYHSTALRWALLTENIEMAVLLIERGAQLRSGEPHNWPIGVLSGADNVRRLLDRGVSAEQLGVFGLAIAVEAGDCELVRRLLERGADPNDISLVGTRDMPVQHAIVRHQSEILALFKDHGVTLESPCMLNPLRTVEYFVLGSLGRALKENSRESIEQRLNEIPQSINGRVMLNWKEQGLSPLQYYIQYHCARQTPNRGAIVQLLLERGADPSVVTASGETLSDLARNAQGEPDAEVCSILFSWID